MRKMKETIDSAPTQENLKATNILDIAHEEIQKLAKEIIQQQLPNRIRIQKAHLLLVSMLRPVYSVDELQPVSKTLAMKRGSCSQRMACLEAVSRAVGIPTRVRAIYVSGKFWYPRFRFLRVFIPKRILLVWPQFFLEETWLDFDELHAPIAQLAATASRGFGNDAESLFEAVQVTPVDFFGKTCGIACARPDLDLSRFVLEDRGFFNTRDEAFAGLGSFQHTLRGHLFEMFLGDRKSV
jgi:transglutaminase-like putative cysteine protease